MKRVRKRELTVRPGDQRQAEEGEPEREPKKRRFAEDLDKKVESINTEIADLNALANTHSIASYFDDLFSQFAELSDKVKRRLHQLSTLDTFLVRPYLFSSCTFLRTQ